MAFGTVCHDVWAFGPSRLDRGLRHGRSWLSFWWQLRILCVARFRRLCFAYWCSLRLVCVRALLVSEVIQGCLTQGHVSLRSTTMRIADPKLHPQDVPHLNQLQLFEADPERNLKRASTHSMNSKKVREPSHSGIRAYRPYPLWLSTSW